MILLTARGEETDRIVGLKLGADDYVTKPFSPGELVARIESLTAVREPLAPMGMPWLKPEAMLIDTRVILTGPAEAFQILYVADEEFRDIFKLRADFGEEAEGVVGADAAQLQTILGLAALALRNILVHLRQCITRLRQA